MQAEIGNPDGGGTLYAVIMAGGKGTRFWPRSRERMPKHLLDIVGERTIIQETLARLSPLIPPDRTLVVTGASHAEELMRQLPEVPPDRQPLRGPADRQVPAHLARPERLAHPAVLPAPARRPVPAAPARLEAQPVLPDQRDPQDLADPDSRRARRARREPV